MITKTPAWAVGMRKLMPGVYVKDRELHFDIPELCEANGYACNEHNARMVIEAANQAVRASFGDVKVTEMFEP